MYKGSDKICELMSREEDAIQIISRFGLAMGVGEQTIAEVCEAHDVHTPTFLAIVNYKVFHQRVVPADIDIPTLQRYLHDAAEAYELASLDEEFLLRSHALFSYGRVLEATGKYKEAVEAYQKLNDEYPDESWTNLAKTRILELKIEGKVE